MFSGKTWIKIKCSDKNWECKVVHNCRLLGQVGQEWKLHGKFPFPFPSPLLLSCLFHGLVISAHFWIMLPGPRANCWENQSFWMFSCDCNGYWIVHCMTFGALPRSASLFICRCQITRNKAAVMVTIVLATKTREKCWVMYWLSLTQWWHSYTKPAGVQAWMI